MQIYGYYTIREARNVRLFLNVFNPALVIRVRINHSCKIYTNKSLRVLIPPITSQ